MSAGRLKSKRRPIGSLAEADAVLAELGRIQRDVEREEASAERRIEAIKAGAAEKIAPQKALAEALVGDLERFVTDHREEVLGKAKSKALNHGKIGFRKSTKENWPDDEVVFQKLAMNSRPDLIKTNPKPDKAAIRAAAKAGDFELGEFLGVEIEVRDIFFVEPDRSAIGERTPADGS